MNTERIETVNENILAGNWDTWLPVFPGFYNTMFEPDYDNLEYDIVEIGIIEDA